jgi:hypothetical protein
MKVTEEGGIWLDSELLKEFVLGWEATHLSNDPVFKVHVLEIKPHVRHTCYSLA